MVNGLEGDAVIGRKGDAVNGRECDAVNGRECDAAMATQRGATAWRWQRKRVRGGNK